MGEVGGRGGLLPSNSLHLETFCILKFAGVVKLCSSDLALHILYQSSN